MTESKAGDSAGGERGALGRGELVLLDGFMRWKRGDLNTEEFEGLFHELLYQHCAAHPSNAMAAVLAQAAIASVETGVTGFVAVDADDLKGNKNG